MNQPSPAIVAQGAVRRLPRYALLAICIAYILPGFIGRSPWKSNDIAAFGYMLEMARGTTSWITPQIADIPLIGDGLLPYWLGALAIRVAPEWASPALAARIPFVCMLALTLAATWYAVYYLARSPRAQPVAFAFGGEASPTDYARAMADGGLLALVACLGLAQLSHEATTSLAQLCFGALVFYGVAAIGYRNTSPVICLVLGQFGLALSAAPALAVLFGVGSSLVHLLARDPAVNTRRRATQCAGVIALVTVLAAALASGLHLWQWRILLPEDAQSRDARTLARLLLWFTWPAWPLVVWTIWRWRFQIFSRDISPHVALPLWVAAVCIATTLTTRPADRALMLALPSLATLAAFALPTIQRNVAALIDWFTLLFFSGVGFLIWLIWLGMQTGFPRAAAASVVRQAPDYQAVFSPTLFLIALAGTAVWGWLVHWRVGRNQSAIWKSLVLPAGGVTWCWLLLMTLWLPLLDYVRGYTVVVQNVQAVVGRTGCIATHELDPGQVAAFRYHSRYTLIRANPRPQCAWLLADPEQPLAAQARIDPAHWRLKATIRRSSDKADEVLLYERIQPY